MGGKNALKAPGEQLTSRPLQCGTAQPSREQLTEEAELEPPHPPGEVGDRGRVPGAEIPALPPRGTVQRALLECPDVELIEMGVAYLEES